MIRQISCLLLVFPLFVSCENRYRKGSPSSHSSSVDSKFVGKTSDDAYQVSASEYDNNFVSRYGLLYLKASNDPFTGRILTVDSGESGEFVSSDESWSNGKKHGKSSKWFSNGIKMYERNYQEGRWHGSVTRWWPNGQKMYVRAYTNGVRHGSEATWRSDGTPLSLPSGGMSSSNLPVDEGTMSTESLPSIDLNDGSSLQGKEGDPVSEDLQLNAPATLEQPAIGGLPEPSFDSSVDKSGDAFSDLPTFPPMQDDALNSSDEGDLRSLPSDEETDLILPGFVPEAPSDNSVPQALPDDPSGGLPALPGLDETSSVNVDAPLPLPGLPDEGDAGPLPALPAMEDEGGLPPLPGGGDEGFGDLPPLPPLP